MLEECCSLMNCSLSYTNPADQLWGKVVNGSFTGHMGEIVEGRADVAVAGVILTYNTSMVEIILLQL